jgi:predicted Ser/Thr protein kinase
MLRVTLCLRSIDCIAKAARVPRPPSNPLANLLFGRFQLEHCLGAGHATVWSARDIKTQTRVAVKLTHVRSSACEQLQNEHQLLTTALRQCRSGPEVVHFGTFVNQLVLVEVPVGECLPAWLTAQSFLSPQKKAAVLEDVASQLVVALKDIHFRGVLHRDVKPENIIIVKGQVKLIDFGSAMAIEGQESVYGSTKSYASANYLASGKPCRMDDFESACFTMRALEVGVRLWEARARSSLVHIAGISPIVRELLAFRMHFESSQ